MKVKTINVIITPEYDEAEIHSYLISDNLPANTINRSVAEAYDKFHNSIEMVINLFGLEKMEDRNMAEVMEKGFWDSECGTTIEIVRSTD